MMEKVKRLVAALALSLAAFGVLAEPVDVNTATADQIAEAMAGVGKAKAEAIIQDREQNGKFKSIDDLARVKGIKIATIAKNRDKITVK
jgi:competence protein ComEA